MWEWLSECYVPCSVALSCLQAAPYWSRTSNGREWNWLTLMHAGVVCRRWGKRRGFHLSEIIRRSLCYVFGKAECSIFLMSLFVNFCLGVVRTWWRSGVLIHVGCGECGMLMPIGVYWMRCTWWVLYIFVLDVYQFDQRTRGDRCGTVIGRCHLAYMYCCYWFEFRVCHGSYYFCGMWFGS